MFLFHVHVQVHARTSLWRRYTYTLQICSMGWRRHGMTLHDVAGTPPITAAQIRDKTSARVAQ